MNPYLKTLVLLTAAACSVIVNGAALSASLKQTTYPTDSHSTLTHTVIMMVKRKSSGAISWQRIEVPENQIKKVKQELLNDPNVIQIDYDHRAYIPQPISSPELSVMSLTTTTPSSTLLYPNYYNDPYYKDQRIFQEWEGISMQLIDALKRLNSSRAIRVGVIDGGFNSASGDVYYSKGISFVDNSNCSPHDHGADHGAKVASIFTATPNNGYGIAGIAPNTELIVAEVANCKGAAYLSDITSSIRWLSGNAIDTIEEIPPVEVINISLATNGEDDPNTPQDERTCPAYLNEAIQDAVNKGIIIVAAAGNNSTNANNVVPANCDDVITVTASTHEGQLASFSNTGSNVDIAASGTEILALNGQDNVTGDNSGTSFSAPIVAGIISAIKSDRPDITPIDFKYALAQSGTALNTSALVGGGILNAMRLMDKLGFSSLLINGVNGERAKYKEALLHPEAEKYLDQPACSLIEIDGSSIPPESSTDYLLTLFKVSEGESLLPNNGIIIAQANDKKFIIDDLPENAVTGFSFGLTRCESGGGNCALDATVEVDKKLLIRPEDCKRKL